MNKKFSLCGLFVFAVLTMVCFASFESCSKKDSGTPPPVTTPPVINTPPPVISSFKPDSGAKESTVVITGSNFSNSLTGNTVTFNGKAATVVSATADSLTVTVPSGARTGKISVMVGSMTVNSTDDFNYILTVSTLAGDGTASFKEGTGVGAEFKFPYGVAADISGNVYVADRLNNRIRFIAAGGIVRTLAGTGSLTFRDGPALNALFDQPSGVAADSNGNVYVADLFNHRIRLITSTGTVVSLGGNGLPGYAEGSGTTAQFNDPSGVAVDVSGNVYVADEGNNRIRKISGAGVVSTLAGNGIPGFVDGAANAAEFNSPTGVALDRSGNIYVADFFNNRIRKITPAGVVTTLAGDGNPGYKDGPGAEAKFNTPYAIATDASGNVYVTDPGNSRIRKITPSGVVSTLAGDGTQGFKDGIGIAAQFDNPLGIAVDALGNIYVGDTYNNRIRMLQ